MRFQQDGQVRGRRNDGTLFQIPQSGRMTALVRPLVAISAGLALTVVVASASSAADEGKPAAKSKPAAKAEAVGDVVHVAQEPRKTVGQRAVEVEDGEGVGHCDCI